MRDCRIPLVLFLICVAAVARAQGPTPAGGELLVNSYTTDRQNRPAVAAAGGNFVVVWQSLGQDGSSYGIHGQRFDAQGQALGAEFQVNSFTTSLQTYPAAAADGTGNFVVVWQSSGPDGDLTSVQGQRYDAAGSPIAGEFQVNSYTTTLQGRPAVAMAAGGAFVVVWQSGSTISPPGPDGDGLGIRGQRFDSAGGPLASEFQVNVFTTGSQRLPAIAIGDLGDFVVTWVSEFQDGSGYSVHGRRFDSAGGALGGEFQVNSYTSGYQGSPSVAVDPEGRFVVVWSGDGADGDRGGVAGQRYDAAGLPLGGEFQVNTFTTAYQGPATVATDGQGNFLVVWQAGFDLTDGDGRSAQGQLFDAGGTPVGVEFQVNTYTTDNQGFPRVAIGGGGAFAVWQSFGQDGDDYGVVAQRYRLPAIFADGLESGDTSRWSSAVP